MDINSLFEFARQGDKRAESHLFEYLSARFSYFVYQRLQNKEVADEIVQETIMAILKEYKHLVVETSFSAWAYKVLDNRILNYIGSKKREFEKKNKLKENLNSSDNSIDPSYDLKRHLMECLKKIAGANLRYARVLNLSYQGFKTDEICARMDLTATNLYSILSRARSLLELCLETGRIK